MSTWGFAKTGRVSDPFKIYLIERGEYKAPNLKEIAQKVVGVPATIEADFTLASKLRVSPDTVRWCRGKKAYGGGYQPAARTFAREHPEDFERACSALYTGQIQEAMEILGLTPKASRKSKEAVATTIE